MEPASFPYAWRDVAVVHFLCALPLAGVVAAFLCRWFSHAVSLTVAVSFLGLGIIPFVTGPPGSTLLGVICRSGAALGISLGTGTLLAAFLVTRQTEGRPDWRRIGSLLGVWLVVALLLPWTYVRARCRNDQAQLGELLEQARFAEARPLVQALLVLDPQGTWNGRPLTEIAADVDQRLRLLRIQTADPLPLRATPTQRLNRAQQLAMLGRTEEALDGLHLVRDPAAIPDVELLRGTIYEARGDWEQGLTAYERARQIWEQRSPAKDRDDGLLSATLGVAYCQRKQGYYAEAEAAYQQALVLAPTAETHFLLAQFYEDSQQASLASRHARRAAELDPKRYEKDAEKMIRRLTVFHFGCLEVFEAERTSGTKSDRP